MNAQPWEFSSWFMRLAFGRRPLRTLVRMLVLVVAAFVIFRYLAVPIRVTGISMEPTYLNGKVSFVNRMAYKWSKPKRGDVVASKMPADRDMLLKRIVALPGERVSLSSGAVILNGERLEEPYIKGRGGLSSYDPVEYTVEEDHYFVVGDNRLVSVYFQVPAWFIVGKVIY